MLQKTNLEKCKEMAINFLYLDIDTSSEFAPAIVSHPFFESAFNVAENGELVDILEDKKGYQSVINVTKKKIEKISDYEYFFMLITKPYRMVFLKYTMPFLDKEDFSKALISTWISDERANSNCNVTKRELLNYFQKASREYLMNKEELEIYKQLDDVVTVYRGVSEYNKNNIKVLSWTLDKEKAEWFANRWKTIGYVYQAKINKNDIIAFCDQRAEKEIIVNYNKLYDIELVNTIENNLDEVNQDYNDYDY